MAPTWYRNLFLLVSHSTLLLAQCPPLGPILPAPTGLSQHPRFQELVAQINAQLQNISSSLNQTAVSVGLSSAHDNERLISFHYTPQIFNTSGTNKVDGDTVYRVGSTSKLFTALSILQLESKISLTDPVTKYVPQLGDLSESSNSLTEVNWNTVTIEALASHMGGIPADRTLIATVVRLEADMNYKSAALPFKMSQGMPRCLGCHNYPNHSSHFLAATHQINQHAHGKVSEAILSDNILLTCPSDFFNNIGKSHPVYRPFTTPVYSNIGYSLLGLVIEKVSGQSYADYLEYNIIKKAGMNRTTVTDAPASNLGFLPAESNWWGTSLGFKDM